MTSLVFSCAIALLLFICITEALQLFQTVKGNCSSLPLLPGYDNNKTASGEWYFHYGSFGQEGDKCSSGHSVQRGTKNYIDMLLYDAETKDFINLPNDVTYDPERPGVYISEQGSVGHMLAGDPNKYFYYVQCMEVNGKTQILGLVTTRSRQLKEEAKNVYKKISDMLAEKKLLPKMHQIDQTDCEFE